MDLLVTRSSRSRLRPRQLLRAALALSVPRRRLLIRGPGSDPAVCLTFDDGPHPEYTPRLLDVLREQQVSATFFVVGRHAERHPDLVRRMFAEGHAVGHHSYSHSDPGQTLARQLMEEVVRTRQLLAELTGRAPDLFRPPHGKVTAAKLWRLWRAGQTVVLWNIDPQDFACASAGELTEWFRVRPLSGGDVVLFHDNRPYASEALPELIVATRRQGLSFCTAARWAK